MDLLKFRVKDFRGIVDSGWIDCQRITAFVGSNESGKTTLLMALMKLMDSKKEFQTGSTLKSNVGGLNRIKLSADIPIDRAEELMPVANETVFIEAEFVMDKYLSDELVTLGQGRFKRCESVRVSKTYGGKYSLNILDQFEEEDRQEAVNLVLKKLPVFMYFKEVTEVKSDINLIALAFKLAGKKTTLNLSVKETIYANLLNYLDVWQRNLIRSIEQVYGPMANLDEKDVDFDKIFDSIPMFRERFDRGFKKLSTEFSKWWGDEEITISYVVYKKGVSIKIYDANGKSYSLENRSTGFKRFFSLFLAFSVSAKQDFENAIMLFDEAGAALHPLTQRKLINFFGELSKNAQIMFNSHTAYMLPVDQMNRTRLVYKDCTGHVAVTAELRLTSDRSNEESLFIAQSALGLYVSEKALAGCMPVVVLNESDEFYLSIIRNILSAEGKLRSIHTILIFATGENGIDSAAEAFSDGEDYPVILLPSDEESRKIKQRLVKGKYKKCQHKVCELSDIVSGCTKFEDLMPANLMEIFSHKYLQGLLGDKFAFNKSKDIIAQIEEFAEENGITLPEKYRGELAKRMKINTMIHYGDVHISGKYMNDWVKVWKSLLK